MKNYDVVIVGGGPAGLTSAIYALRSGHKVLLIEGEMVGGQCNYSYEVVNYPGFDKITGSDLAFKMLSQAQNLGLETLYESVVKLDLINKQITTNSSQITATCIILAMGAKARKLNVSGEDKFMGQGVHYCAVCDGGFYKNKTVVMIGGGDSAAEESVYLSNICKKVIMINKKPDLVCQPYLKKQVLNKKNIQVINNANVVEIVGNNGVNSVVVNAMQKQEKLAVDGVFVAIGRVPNNELILGQVELTPKGYVKSNERMHTSVEGVFVAGDLRDKHLRQIITACADGAIAGNEASEFINKRG